LAGISTIASSQNVGINVSGAAPNASALLDVNGSPNYNQGVLIPRLTDAQRQALKSPVAGLLIYNTTFNTPNIYNGSGWQQIDTMNGVRNVGSGSGPGGGIAINTTGNAANASALLDVSSTTKGLLIPRTIPASVTPVQGLIIYNTTTNSLNFYNGSVWEIPCTNLLDNTVGSGAVAEGVAINTTGATADPSAILDIASTTEGFLLPNLTSAQRNALPSPAQGLFIYNTTDQNIEYWNGTAWEQLSFSIVGVTASASPANPVCTGTSVSLTGTATNGTTWSWAGPNSYSSSAQNPNIATFTYSNAGTYTLTPSNGCGAGAMATVSVTPDTSYIAVTLTNSAASAAVNNLPVMITVNSSTYANQEDPNLKNIEFSTQPGGKGTVLQAWIESGATNASTSTVYWVNIGSNTIAASGGTLTIYMNFMPTAVMSAAGPTGEAPQLSGTYGQYDNGASVFSFYDDFAGTSFNAASNWIVSGITYTVNNGFNATATAVDGFILSKNVAINPASKIVDFYGNVFTNSSGLNWIAVGAGDGGATGGTTGYGFGDMIVGSYPVASQVNGWQRFSLGGLTATGSMQSSSAAAIWTVTPISASTTNFYINYGGIQTVSTNADSYPLYEGLIAAGAYNSTYTFTNPVSITWYRVRIYPPANTMPTATFGALVCL
jgi:hypothetical protein